MSKKSTDGAVIAPEPIMPTMPMQPRQKMVERQGNLAEPYVRRYPQVRAGTCEYCGVLDPNVPAQYQYKLCPHYRGMELRCSYCDASKDPSEVIGKSTMNVYDHPDKPNTLVIVCDSYDCTRAHQLRFQRKGA